jgi:hypothetical protein
MKPARAEQGEAPSPLERVDDFQLAHNWLITCATFTYKDPSSGDLEALCIAKNDLLSRLEAISKEKFFRSSDNELYVVHALRTVINGIEDMAEVIPKINDRHKVHAVFSEEEREHYFNELLSDEEDSDDEDIDDKYEGEDDIGEDENPKGPNEVTAFLIGAYKEALSALEIAVLDSQGVVQYLEKAQNKRERKQKIVKVAAQCGGMVVAAGLGYAGAKLSHANLSFYLHYWDKP